jgi:hypothetical protein
MACCGRRRRSAAHCGPRSRGYVATPRPVASAAPRRLITVLIDTWDEPNNRATLLAIAQAGATPETAGLTRGFVDGVLLAPVAERLRGAGLTKSDAHRCSALLATQLVGVIYARYVLTVDAVAAMSRKNFLDYYSIGLTAVLGAFTRRATGA